MAEKMTRRPRAARPPLSTELHTPLLEVVKASVQFGGVNALQGISIRLAPGHLYGIVGPNGSGKTTLLNVISRLADLNEGALYFRGEEYSRSSTRWAASAGISRTFQGIRLLSALTVLENVMLAADPTVADATILGTWLSPRAASRQQRASRERALAALERLDLQSVADRSPSTLSYGTQRRVEIARAIAGGPSLLLLDEPTAGMNRGEREAVCSVLSDLSREGLTQVLVEHNLEMMHNLAETLLVMNFGELIAEGRPAEVTGMAVVQEAYLGREQHVDS